MTMIKIDLGKCLLICGALAGLSLSTKPALALDDGKGNSLLDALGFFGLGDKEDEKVVLYRERPPLVLPPKTELRQPLPPAAERTSNWPKDPEVVRAAKQNELNRYRAQQAENNDPNLAGKLAREGRIAATAPQPGSEPCSMDQGSPQRCDPNTFWKNLSVSIAAPKDQELRPGVEPERKYLTEPPAGFRVPKKALAATFEKPASDPNDGDPYGYARSQGHPAPDNN